MRKESKLKEPLVSVCLITYNHVRYIAQAIDSVLAQKVNYSWEVIIADDFSIDGTREIIKEYARLNPKLIRLVLQDQNVGPAQNWFDLLEAAKSKYIAYLEGDDYWIDKNKLTKQIDFLELHHNYTACAHNAEILYDAPASSPRNLYFNPTTWVDRSFGFKDILRHHSFPSGSLLYRNVISLPNYVRSAGAGDNALYLFLAEFGMIKYFSEVMAVYRHHSNGLSKKNAANHQLMLDKRIGFLDNFNVDREFRFTKQIHNAKFHFYRRKVIGFIKEGEMSLARDSYLKCLKSLYKSDFRVNRSEIKFLLLHLKLLVP